MCFWTFLNLKALYYLELCQESSARVTFFYIRLILDRYVRAYNFRAIWFIYFLWKKILERGLQIKAHLKLFMWKQQNTRSPSFQKLTEEAVTVVRRQVNYDLIFTLILEKVIEADFWKSLKVLFK